jgi:hypothetical protein
VKLAASPVAETPCSGTAIEVAAILLSSTPNSTACASAQFYHLHRNLYLVKTAEQPPTGKSCIEDFFDAKTLATTLDGKKFNPKSDYDSSKEFGKGTFAEKLIRAHADKIDFSKFTSILERIVAVIDHYKPPSVAA